MNTNTQRSSTPLYKVLNEERTQGVLQLEENPFWGNRIRLNTEENVQTLTTIFVIEDFTQNKKEATANAQYTALAVNNLDKLALALECILDAVQKEDTGLNPMWKQYILENCNEALNKIS